MKYLVLKKYKESFVCLVDFEENSGNINYPLKLEVFLYTITFTTIDFWKEHSLDNYLKLLISKTYINIILSSILINI